MDQAEVQAEGETRHRSPWKRFRRGVKWVLSRPILWLAKLVLPLVYLSYMWFVWKTSRVEDEGFNEKVDEICFAHDGLVGMLWHEEVFSVAWAYRSNKPHTLASRGDAGEIITRLLNLCGYVVFRGGSSSHKSRRSEHILKDMIDHMKGNHRVMFGLTVDGSKGPPHVMKKGAIVIAKECGRPLVLSRLWAKRNVRLPTWDRMAIPLPFNRIRLYLQGPYYVPTGADDPEVLEKFRREMEQELEAMTARSLVF